MLKFLLLASIAAKPTQKGLYTSDDHVEILDHTNFHATLEDTSQLWIIEFYASWCGHCQHFAPVIRKWSDDIQNWGRLVSIGTIDCGDNQNHEICTSNNINGFPTMKYFPIGERNFETKNIIDGRNDVDLMRDTIRVIKENIPKKVPISFEDLATVDQVDNQVNQLTDRPFVLVIGDSENTLSVERLMIEFSTFNDISIGMSLQKSTDLECENSPDSVACKFKIEHFPSIIVIKHDGSDPVIVGADTLEGQWGVHDGDQLMRNLGSELGLKPSHNWDQQSHIADIMLKSDSAERWRDFDQSKVYLKDIESSILQLLFYDVKIFPIDSTKLDHLKTIVKFLSDRYPTTSANLHISLENISKEIDSLSEIKKRKDWIQILTKTGLTSVQGENPTLEYAACTPSLSNHRGYSCALWTLFHYLLVNSDDSTTLQAAEVIHSIVTDFFGCSDCVENFKKEIVTFPIAAVNDNKSGVLWLWTLHNSVNKRLSGDESEDPEFPKVQWPPASLCEMCHNSDNSGFNTDQVHKFILNRNKLENIILPVEEKIIHSIDDDSAEELKVDEEVEMDEEPRIAESDEYKSAERKEFGGRLEDEDDDDEDAFEEEKPEESIEEKIIDNEIIPDLNEGAGLSEDEKPPSDGIILGEVIKALDGEKNQEEIAPAEIDVDIEIMGAHIEVEIPVDDKNVEEILSKELEEQLLAPIIEIINNGEKKGDSSVVQIASPAEQEIAKEPDNVQKKKVPNWIDAGIEQHLEDQKKKPAQKLLGRVKEHKSTDNGLAHYINDLHKIGFDEDEIESMLKEVNIARMSEHVSELKHRVENYLAEHRHENHEPHEEEHSHDEKWIPAIHRRALDTKLRRLNALRLDMESQFQFIGFSLFDTYFYLLLWCSSIFILAWFYCGYNCRVCYARRKPIYRFIKNYKM